MDVPLGGLHTTGEKSRYVVYKLGFPGWLPSIGKTKIKINYYNAQGVNDK